jgi:hypothetical protein
MSVNHMLLARIRHRLNATTICKAMVMRFVGLIAFAFLILALALYFLVAVPVNSRQLRIR